MSNPSSQPSRGSDPIYWLIAIGLLITGFAAPVGVIMIVLKLLGGKKRGRHPYYAQREGQGPVGARTTAPRQEPASGQGGRNAKAGQFQSQIAQINAKGRKLTIVGGILSAVFGFCTVMAVTSSLWILPDVVWFLEETLPIVCFLFGSLGCLWAGLRKRKQAGRWRSYLAMVGTHASVSISALASAAGSSPKQVREDLEDMLEDGLLPRGLSGPGRGPAGGVRGRPGGRPPG